MEDGTGCLGKPKPRPPDVWGGVGGWRGAVLARAGERSQCGGSLPAPFSHRSLSSAPPGTEIAPEAEQWILELGLMVPASRFPFSSSEQ